MAETRVSLLVLSKVPASAPCFVLFSIVASGPRDQSPAVVVTVVTISALLVLGSVMSVLAIWRRWVAGVTLVKFCPHVHEIHTGKYL